MEDCKPSTWEYIHEIHVFFVRTAEYAVILPLDLNRYSMTTEQQASEVE